MWTIGQIEETIAQHRHFIEDFQRLVATPTFEASPSISFSPPAPNKSRVAWRIRRAEIARCSTRTWPLIDFTWLKLCCADICEPAAFPILTSCPASAISSCCRNPQTRTSVRYHLEFWASPIVYAFSRKAIWQMSTSPSSAFPVHWNSVNQRLKNTNTSKLNWVAHTVRGPIITSAKKMWLKHCDFTLMPSKMQLRDICIATCASTALEELAFGYTSSHLTSRIFTQPWRILEPHSTSSQLGIAIGIWRYSPCLPRIALSTSIAQFVTI